MDINIQEEDMYVRGTPYSHEFRNKCSGLGGHIERAKGRPGCVWVFPVKNEDLVREALLECYGENGLPQKTVTVFIEPGTYMKRDSEYLMLGEITVARKKGRDGGTLYHKGVTLIAGSAGQHGGSKQHPLLNFSENAVLRYDGYPEVLVGRIAGLPGIRIKEEDKKCRKKQEVERSNLKFAEKRRSFQTRCSMPGEKNARFPSRPTKR